MKTTTITEALAELKTIAKRIETKRQFIATYLLRQEALKDPLEKEGGSVQAIARETQAIADLQENILAIRRGIARANGTTTITVEGVTRSIADWLVWKREIAPTEGAFLSGVAGAIKTRRDELQKKGVTMVAVGAAQGPNDVIVHLDERALSDRVEKHQQVLGTLDGQLSLKNATITIEY